MARLSIGVERLGAEGFRLELGGKDGAPNVVGLAPGGGIRGRYEQDEEVIGLRSIRADTLVLSEFGWSLSAGRIEVSAPSRLREVEIDATIARGDKQPKFVGSIRAGQVEATLNLALGNVDIHGASVTIQGFELAAGEDGKVAIRLGHVTAGSVKAVLEAIELVATSVSTPGSVTIDSSGIRFDALEVGQLQARLPDLAALRKTPPDDPTDAPPKGNRGIPELPFLAMLSGQLNLDVIPDVTLPIIGTRRAKHQFRIPIERGVVGIKKLESSLSTLESMVIDFEVEDGKLVLEKDLPLVPFDNTPLVYWPLDRDAQALANDKRVAIATLLRPKLPESARKTAAEDKKKKGKAIDLKKIDVADIDISLRCGGPTEMPVAGGRMRLGSKDHAAIGELTIQGGVTYAPNDPVPGELRVAGKQLRLGLDAIGLGTRALSAVDVGIETLDTITVGFAGVRPSNATAMATGIRLLGVHLGPKPT